MLMHMNYTYVGCFSYLTWHPGYWIIMTERQKSNQKKGWKSDYET